jgi:hypothetical protein
MLSVRGAVESPVADLRDGNIYRGICTECDVLLNEGVLEFMGHPDRVVLMRKYRERVVAG